MNDEGGHARGFGGKLQPARSCHGEASGLTDDAGETGVPQPFFHRRQQRSLVIGFGIDDTVWRKTDGVQGRREEIVAAQAPENRSLKPRKHSGDEERGRRAMSRARPAARDFMQRAQGKSSFRQACVDRRDAERQHGMPLPARLLDAGDPVAQLLEHA